MMSRASRLCLASLLLFTLALVRPLQAQQTYSIGNPSNDQQYMLELINRARADGGAEATRLGLSGLQEGPPTVGGEAWTIANSVQPLSWNPLLLSAAQGQADKLNNADQFFLGGSPHTFGGTNPSQRIAATGYSSATYSGPTTQSGFLPGPENVAEAVSQGQGGYTGATLTAGVLRAHNDLFTDLTVQGRGHRDTTMLAFPREIGIGVSVGTDNQSNPGQPGGKLDSLYLVQEFGRQSSDLPFITGVVYSDTNGNGFYDPGEGIGGVTVTVAGGSFNAVTSSSGGYSVPVSGNGNYTVTFSGGSLPTVQKSAAVSGGLNVKLDYITAAVAGPTVLGNISTRLRVEAGDNVPIAGFIVTGTQPKKLIIRGVGPSLPLADRLANPTLELYDGTPALLETNDDWQSSPNQQDIVNSGLAPGNPLEAAIIRTVAPGSYTAVVRGLNGGTGVGLVEVYDLDRTVDSKLANISTRGSVQTGDNVMIGGTIVLGATPQKVIIRAIGPSLPVAGALADPALELYDANGTLVASNDNWRSTQQAEIVATNLAPTLDAESAIVTTLQPSPARYTAIVRGVGGSTGVARVDVFALDN